MTIERIVTIDKGIEDAWKILGPQFPDANKWASVVNHSEGKGTGSNGAPCSERGCDISGMGKIREKVIQYSDDKHLLSYQVAEGMPSMIKNAINTWQLFSLGNGKTQLKMKMELETRGIMGALMKPMMKMQMGKIATVSADDFKYYVENENPHPRKIKAIKKYKG